jgi:hypothetical protein
MFPMSCDYPWKVGYSLYQQAPLHTSEVCARKSTTGLFNSLIYLVTYPLRFHRRCEHRTHPESPSCALWVPAIAAAPTPSHGSAITAPPNIPVVLPRLNSTTYCDRTYHICSWLYCFHGWSLHEPILRFGYDN